MADEGLRPIIVKRIKTSGGGHHGGAWKIAYADFVTAMMAFFLLMWLLGSTTKGDLNGISEYFKTPLKVAMQGGSGSGDSSSVIPGGGKDLTRKDGQVKGGDDPATRDHGYPADFIRSTFLNAFPTSTWINSFFSISYRLLSIVSAHFGTSAPGT